MQSHVLGAPLAPFLACTSCYMYAKEPRHAWRGPAKDCNGAEAGASRGSRAQAQNDLAKGGLPGKDKAPIPEFATPTASTKALWAEKLRVECQAEERQEA